MATEFNLPNLGENIEAGDVVRVLVSVGDRIEPNQPLLELETDKAVVEVPSSVTGVVKAVHVSDGDRAEVGQLILTVEEEAAVETPSPPPSRESEAEPPPEEPRAGPAGPAAEVIDFDPARSDVPGRPVPAAPSVRRFAREIGVSIDQVPGTGPRGRISVGDVKVHSRTRRSSAPPSPAAVELPDFSRWGEVERQPFSNVRRKTARHLSAAWSGIPHVTQHDKADITELEQARRRHGAKAEAEGGKLTVTAVILKAVAAGLKAMPQFNASVDMASEEIVFKKYSHIGVAVDTDRGLLVPVIRNVDRKNIIELSVELSRLAARARDARLTLEEMQGGCFTVSNLGGIGGTHFTPIINAPEVAILGVSRAVQEPVYRDGEFTPRLMLPLSLSYDHRLIDGADGIRFLRRLVEALEDPFLISLEG